MKYGIVAIGYNRFTSMQRLLEQLTKCRYDESVDLIISLDKGDNEVLYEYVDSFQWEFGEKTVIKHSERLGLKEQVLSCGDLVNQYEFDAIAVFEDDMFPGEDFFRFMKQSVEYYKDDENIAGISLYTHKRFPGVQLPFTPQTSEYDVFFMKVAQSFGQVWTRQQWNGFKKWYENNSALWNSNKYVPDYVAKWPKSSWLKYYCRYCGEENKYFVYPYQALVTCFSEAGEHTVRTSAGAQVPVARQWDRNYYFVDLYSKDAIKYDAFWENEYVAAYCAETYGLDENEVAVDIYGINGNIHKRKYWVTQRVCDYEIIDSFALEFKPHEMNVVLCNRGHDIFIYNTEKIVRNRTKKQKYVNQMEYYLTREFYRRNINRLVGSVYLRSVGDFIKTLQLKFNQRRKG
ncbi:MAG: hypothetical protein LIO41_04510 [Ruminococcus sp.]|nr:hypothetical protein [Ruminococcus sp.]